MATLTTRAKDTRPTIAAFFLFFFFPSSVAKGDRSMPSLFHHSLIMWCTRRVALITLSTGWWEVRWTLAWELSRAGASARLVPHLVSEEVHSAACAAIFQWRISPASDSNQTPWRLHKEECRTCQLKKPNKVLCSSNKLYHFLSVPIATACSSSLSAVHCLELFIFPVQLMAFHRHQIEPHTTLPDHSTAPGGGRGDQGWIITDSQPTWTN